MVTQCYSRELWCMCQLYQSITAQPYLTKELARRPTRPTALPATAVTLQPKMSVKTLTMGEQKKIMPMEREPTQAAGRHTQPC